MLANQADYTALYSALGLVIVTVVSGVFANRGKKIEKQRTTPENTSLEITTMRSVIETVNAERALEREERKALSVEANALRKEVSDLHDELRVTFDDVRLALTILQVEVGRLRGMLKENGINPGSEPRLPALPHFLLMSDTLDERSDTPTPTPTEIREKE